MKIVIATGIFVPELGGPATYAPNIAKEFLALGHQVKVLTYSDKNKYDFDADFDFPVFRIKRGNKLINYLKYFKKLSKIAKDSDIIYAFDHFSAGIPTALFCKIYKKPLYIRVGGDFIWERYIDNAGKMVSLREFYEKGLHQKYENIRFKIIKFIFSVVHGIIFTTGFQKDIFKKYYQLPDDKLFIIKNPIILSDAISRESVTKEIIFAGRFNRIHNIFNLIEAFHNIKNNDFSLVLIGDGPLKNDLQNKVRELGDKNIHIENKMSRRDLKKRIANAYLLVWPTLTDISPNAMLEAISLNVPIISTKELGFSWLRDRIKIFDPKNVNEISETISGLLNYDNYQEYSRLVEQLDYDYSYSQASKDTLNIFSILWKKI